MVHVTVPEERELKGHAKMHPEDTMKDKRTGSTKVRTRCGKYVDYRMAYSGYLYVSCRSCLKTFPNG